MSVSQATTGAAVFASSTSYTSNQPVTLTAFFQAVSPSYGIPTGYVNFFDVTGGTIKALGSVRLTNSGTTTSATLVSSSLGAGKHSVYVTYAGDASDSGSASARASFTVGASANQVDLDGDGKADISVYGLIGNSGKYGFQTVTSSSGFNTNQTIIFNNNGYGFGNSTSIPVTADYFGDGKSAYAVWTPNNGGMTFAAISSVNPGKSLSINFGGPSDVPVIADVDGDGKPDFGIYGYQPGLGYRFDFLLSTDNFNVNQQSVFNNNGYGYGNATSVPVVADFDGSGRAGFGLVTASSSTSSFFTYISPSSGVSFSRSIGGAGQVATSVNYDSDGKADLALYGINPSTGLYGYQILTSSSNYNPSSIVTFDNNGNGYGNASAIPILGDYQGIGMADLGLTYLNNNSGSEAYLYQSNQTGPGVFLTLGTTNDIPLSTPAYLRAKLVRAGI